MGAWGTGVYDNDDALDWVLELEARGFGAIVEAFETVANDDYLDREAVCAAIAAADVVARLKGGGEIEAGYAESASRWAAGHRGDGWSPLVRPAIGVLDRVMRADENENYELWAETDELDDWLRTVQSVRDRLATDPDE